MTDYKENADKVRDRINLLLREKKITQNSVAAGDTSAQKRLNSQLGHGAAITLDSLLRVIEACPDVSAEWLLRGLGDMLLGDGKTGGHIATNSHIVTNSHYETHTGSTLPENLVRDILAKKDEQIQTLLELLRR